MNETLLRLSNKDLELYQQYRFTDFELHTSLIENHFLQLQKDDSPVSSLLVTTPVSGDHYPLIIERKFRVTATKDFTKS